MWIQELDLTPCRSLPTTDILFFCDSTSGTCLMQLVGNVAPKFSHQFAQEFCISVKRNSNLF